MASTELDHMTHVGPSQLKLVVTEQGTTTTIGLGGEWDLAAQPVTRQAVNSVFARSPECVVLDLTELAFIDVSAIHVVLGLQKRCLHQHVRLVIAPGSDAVQRPFGVLGLIPTLPFLTAAAWR